MSSFLDRDSDVPLYQQLSKHLKQRITSNEWTAGTTLPSEVELCEVYMVARGTVRQALSQLEQARFVRRERGRGTTVIWQPEDGAHPSSASSQLAFVVPYVRDSFVSTMLLGVERGAADRGWSVTFKHVANDPQRQAEALAELAAQPLAGVILYPVDSVHTEPVARLLEAGIPVVLVDRYLRELATDYVMSDHFGGALRATQHLIQLGHRRIGYVYWRDPAVSLEHRHAGYRQALQEAGLPYDERATCQVEGYPTIEANCLDDFLTASSSMSAVFAANDQIALSVYKAARQLGLRIPEDLALVGFDNLDFTPHLDVPLTTVAQPAQAIGQTAVEVMLARATGEVQGYQQIVLPTRLIVRQSCGALPQTGEDRR